MDQFTLDAPPDFQHGIHDVPSVRTRESRPGGESLVRFSGARTGIDKLGVVGTSLHPQNPLTLYVGAMLDDTANSWNQHSVVFPLSAVRTPEETGVTGQHFSFATMTLHQPIMLPSLLSGSMR